MTRTPSLRASPAALLAAAFAVVATLLPGASTHAASVPGAAGPCVAGWREIPVPDSVFLSTPFEVVNRNGKAAWILGGTNQGVLALRWNGDKWKRTALNTQGHRGLVGGTSVGRNKVLGVGYFRENAGEGNGSLRPISGRVVLSGYRSRRVPDPPGPRATLTGIVSQPGGKAWAVGTRLQDGRLRAYALRWNGRKWLRREPPGGSGSGLLAVTKSSSGSVWAAGWREASLGRPRPLIVRRSGSKWVKVKAGPVPAGSAVVTDLEFRPGEGGYLVGYVTPVGSDRHLTFLHHWDGNSWEDVELPWATDDSALPRSVAVGTDGELWIGGTQTARNTREARGFIAHRKDGTWEVDYLGVPSDIRSEVMDVAATKWGAIAAANVAASLLVLYSCGEEEAPARSAAARAARSAAGKHQIKISHMQARRESVEADEDVDGLDGEAGTVAIEDDGPAGRYSLSGGQDGTSFTLAAPVRPKDFFVKDMASVSGLAQTTKTYDGLAADFDGNGWRDIFIGRHGGIKPRLAMNYGGAFSDAPTGAFGSVDRHGCAAADVDRDGNRDLFCAVGASRGKAVQRHELTLAPATNKRELVRGALGVNDPFGRGRHVALFKLDGDAYPDLFISNAPDRDDGFPGYNRFYRNDKGVFRPAPAEGLDSSHGAECVETGDFDKDGDQDLAYCTQYGFGKRNAGLRFMRNEKGHLRDRTGVLGITPIGDIDAAFADVTGDRRKDLIQLTPTRLRVSKWTSSGYRRIYEARISHAWALAAGDADGDGKDDIYVVRGNDRENKADRLLVSRSGGTRFISVRIPQTKQGSADDVFAVDYDRNGHTDFVVLNGRKKAGPIQLLASFPR